VNSNRSAKLHYNSNCQDVYGFEKIKYRLLTWHCLTDWICRITCLDHTQRQTLADFSNPVFMLESTLETCTIVLGLSQSCSGFSRSTIHPSQSYPWQRCLASSTQTVFSHTPQPSLTQRRHYESRNIDITTGKQTFIFDTHKAVGLLQGQGMYSLRLNNYYNMSVSV
jgi:hypothetical protein